MQNTVNQTATENAKTLLNYLSDIAGNGIVTGQHTQTNAMEETEYIRKLTGKLPKLIGFELLAYSPNINDDDASDACLLEVRENRNTLETAMKIAESTDAILTFSFHWFSPVGGRDKSFYAANTDFDASRVLVCDTLERAAFYHDMDEIAKQLQPFCDRDIPVLWRPFHESDGGWFWWGAKGPEVAKELYKLMFDYYVHDKHLDNLLWVWNCRLSEGYPGDDYVDVISLDEYLPEYRATDYMEQYEELTRSTTRNKVAALAEVGYIPDINMLEKSHVPWAYYMAWSKEFCIGNEYNTQDRLTCMYESDYAVSITPDGETGGNA